MKHKIQAWKTAESRGKRKNRKPPFAPSKNEINFYNYYIKEAKNNKKLPLRALTLGATPELRDIAIKNGFESYAVDFSPEMMNKFSSLMRHRKHSLNKEIISDWLEIGFSKNFFGVVMADASFINLKTKKENEYLIKICSDVLMGGGYLILRQVVYPKTLKYYRDINKLVDDYRQKKILWEDFFMELRFKFFKKQVYNKHTCQYDVSKNFKLIDKLAKQCILQQEEYQSLLPFKNELTNTCYPEKDFIKMVEKEKFRFIEKFQDKGFEFFKYLRMMAFRKLVVTK